MKKIIVGILGFVVLFTAQNVFASSVWNNASNDCPDISVVNSTTNVGYSSPCWNLSNISANPGETINIRIYYHNTGTVTNTNTSIKLNAPTGSSTNHSFSAQITSPQGDLYTGSINVNLPSSQTLTFGSTRWYPNQTSSAASFISGQSGSEIIGSGLSIGNIASGWSTQGSVVVSFKVGSATPPQTCNDPYASNYTKVGDCIPYSTFIIKNTVVGNGTITSASGATSYKYPNTSDFFYFIPAAGYHVESASFDGSPISTSGYAVSNVSANHEIKVIFAADQAPKACVASLSATRSTIVAGEASVLGWTLTDCLSATIYPTVGVIYSSSTQNVYPAISTEYKLTAYGKDGVPVIKTTTVNVTSPQSPVCTATLSATRSTIVAGEASVLGWIINDCTNVNISPTVGNVTASGTRSVSPSASTVYTLTGYSSNGAVTTKIVTVNVDSPLATCSATLSASNTSITNGESSILSWTLADCTSVTIYPTVGSVTASGTRSVSPSASTVYTLTGYNSNGTTITKVAIVAVNEQTRCLDGTATNYGSYGNCTYDQVYNKCVISSFDANDTSISSGDGVTLSWNTRNCTSVYITDIGSVSNRTYGSSRVYPTYTRTYNISASGNNSSDSDSVRIYVDENNNNNNLDCNYYGTCNNNNNTIPTVSTYSPVNVTTISATLSGYASGNGSLINSWIEFPCYGTQYGNRYSQSSVSMTVPVSSLSPNTTYRYCAAAQNLNNGQIYRGTQVSFTTTGGSIQPITYVNKNVVTTVATNINTSTAQVNGYITSSNYYNSNTYFEYGTTVDLGSRTTSKSTVGNSSMNDVLTGLSSNTIYFFRAVGEGTDGVSRGNIEVFKTLGVGGTIQPVVQGTTVVNSLSPVVLTITNKYELIGEGDLMDYTVTYKNIGKTKLSKPMVQVVLPTNVTLINASRGTYSVDNHTLSALVEDLNKGEEGVIYLQAKVDSIPLNNAQIVTTAILVYTGSNGAQENVMAYELNVPKMIGAASSTDGNNQGANAFFAGLISIGLIGWLLIILIILLLILIVRSVYGGNSNNQNLHTPTH